MYAPFSKIWDMSDENLVSTKDFSSTNEQTSAERLPSGKLTSMENTHHLLMMIFLRTPRVFHIFFYVDPRVPSWLVDPPAGS